jgi:hypothetical protein
MLLLDDLPLLATAISSSCCFLTMTMLLLDASCFHRFSTLPLLDDVDADAMY